MEEYKSIYHLNKFLNGIMNKSIDGIEMDHDNYIDNNSNHIQMEYVNPDDERRDDDYDDDDDDYWYYFTYVCPLCVKLRLPIIHDLIW